MTLTKHLASIIDDAPDWAKATWVVLIFFNLALDVIHWTARGIIWTFGIPANP
jgi:hypothetical protein